MTNLATLKNDLRQAALARRDRLEPRWRADASLDAARHATDAMAVPAGTIIAGFLPIRSEIDPLPLMIELAERGARLCLPSIIDPQTIVFRAWTPGDALQEMSLATRGPLENAPEIAPDIILMPLAAFDARGARLGYGGGFYDRAIERLNDRGVHPRLIGIAFSCQEVDHIPAETHDVPIAEILTENGLRRL